MPSLKDSTGEEWLVEFDGLLLGQVRDECRVDLSDPTGAGYVQIELDEPSLVRVLKVLLREHIPERMKERDFSRRFRKQSLTDAIAAIWGAAENFFPEKKMSALRSSFNLLKETAEATAMVRPMTAMLAQMPEGMREAAMQRLMEEVDGNSSDETGEPTATDSEGTPSTPASTTQESPESIRAA